MISVLIASRGESGLLWATLASVRGDLECSGQEFEVIVAANEKDNTFGPIIHELNGSPMARVLLTGADSPQSARMAAYAKSNGDDIFFVDSHCILPPGFFCRLLHERKAAGADVAFGGTRYTGERVSYGLRCAWNGYLWGGEVVYGNPDGSDDPFGIAMAGHGAFCVSREAFDACGGYWTALKGFGGEESQFNLKAWMLGLRLVMCPRIYHWHYLPPGLRRGNELYSDREFVRNFLLVAAAYGNEGNVRAAYNAFRVAHWGFEPKHPELVYEVLESEEVAREKEFIERNAVHKNLFDLRAALDAAGVVS